MPSRQVILLVSQWCATCPDAERLWNKLKSEYNFDFQVLDVSQPDGRALAKKLMIRAVPSTVIDGKLAFVGVPDEAEARKALES